MNQRKRLITRLTIGLGLASIVVCPLTLAAGAGPLAPKPIAQPFGHTPSIEPFATEKAPDELLEDELVLPDIFVEGNILVVNGKPYPIGDAFTDGGEIRTGPRKTDRTGGYGYATIEGLPGYVLLWYIDGTGRKQYLVTTDDDPGLTGPLGFDQLVTDFKQAQDRFLTSVGGGVGAASTAILIQFAVCLGTVGVTCGTAVITAAVLAVGGGITAIGLVAFDLIPAFNNVARGFRNIDATASPASVQP